MIYSTVVFGMFVYVCLFVVITSKESKVRTRKKLNCEEKFLNSHVFFLLSLPCLRWEEVKAVFKKMANDDDGSEWFIRIIVCAVII